MQIGIPENKKWIYSFVFFLAMTIVMQWQGASLKIAIAPSGILALEFANREILLFPLLSNWKLNVVRMNIFLDFIYIVSYTLFFITSLKRLVQKYSKGFYHNVGSALINIALMAALFDIVENVFMLFTISNQYNSISLEITSLFASLKFILIVFIILYLVLAFLVSLYRHK